MDDDEEHLVVVFTRLLEGEQVVELEVVGIRWHPRTPSSTFVASVCVYTDPQAAGRRDGPGESAGMGMSAVTDLHGKSALVCGGSQGIGLAAARELARRGAAVTVLARSRPESGGDRFAFLQADLEKIEELIPGLEKQNPGEPAFDILVNNSGGPSPGPIVEANVEQFLVAFRQHLLASHLLMQWLLPGMRERGFGRVINVISTSVREPIPGLGVSNTIRAAMAAWAKTLSREVGPYGITVNNVLPGATRTERLAQIIQRKAVVAGQSEAAVEERMRAEIPLGRFAEPAELGAVVAFLASPAAGYITGVSLPVDGGRLHCV
jgi:3-oxoacyl-[acyl-carrier protein] reductase